MLYVILSCVLVLSAHAQVIVQPSYCDYACAAGESCVDTGIRCVRAPCPTYQCQGTAGYTPRSSTSSSSLYESLARLLAKLRGTAPPMSENSISKKQLPPPQPQQQQQFQPQQQQQQVQQPQLLSKSVPVFPSSRSRNARVVPGSYCRDKPCVLGEECVDTGLRCVRSPCPGVFQCRRKSTSTSTQEFPAYVTQPYQTPQQQQQNGQSKPGFSSNVPMLSQFGAPGFQQQPQQQQQFSKEEAINPESNLIVVTDPKQMTVVEKLALLKSKPAPSLPRAPSFKSRSSVSPPFKRSTAYPNSYCGDRCGQDEVCVDSEIRCFRAPCPEVFRCVKDKSSTVGLEDKPQCTRRCDPASGWYCALRKSCRRGNCGYVQICKKSRKP